MFRIYVEDFISIFQWVKLYHKILFYFIVPTPKTCYHVLACNAGQIIRYFFASVISPLTCDQSLVSYTTSICFVLLFFVFFGGGGSYIKRNEQLCLQNVARVVLKNVSNMEEKR